HHHAGQRGRELGPQGVAALVQLEVEELLDDLLAGFAREELLVREHGSVHVLVAEARGDGAEVAEEPLATAHVLGVEVARAARRLERARHAPRDITPAGGTPVWLHSGRRSGGPECDATAFSARWLCCCWRWRAAPRRSRSRR